MNIDDIKLMLDVPFEGGLKTWYDELRKCLGEVGIRFFVVPGGLPFRYGSFGDSFVILGKFGGVTWQVFGVVWFVVQGITLSGEVKIVEVPGRLDALDLQRILLKADVVNVIVNLNAERKDQHTSQNFKLCLREANNYVIFTSVPIRRSTIAWEEVRFMDKTGLPRYALVPSGRITGWGTSELGLVVEIDGGARYLVSHDGVFRWGG